MTTQILHSNSVSATNQTPSDQNRHAMRLKKQRIRKWINRGAIALSMTAMLFGLFWLFLILFTTVTKGFGGISMEFFTEMTPPANSEGGGLLNAIVGSGILILWATFIGTPMGIFAGIYLVEYNPNGRLTSVIRFINDVLLSSPSIVIGLFVYTVIVVRMGHFSGLAGILALALIQIPIVIRTTENMLLLVPNTLREAAYALGAPKWKIIINITLKASLSGIMTGIMLAIARISGETAPLLFTTLSNQFWTTNVMEPMASLPVTIYNFAMTPDSNLQHLAWAGVFFMTIAILLLNIIARIFFSPKGQRN
ncbi:phosphate ABC transporter permease PstA [Ignatzschineria sp. RMDPL8A]|uniref:phosphate ABC transporter permease PstA n=1 Tax=Ignatzschineria sp. RMDPL8A TaxID=2999236 RepID=UPI00244664FE|nr:phosphate ABC transporter permease PstA [Ignatzschineria sp. RMDPL8A]MDG9730562.1 phosphate ABC transporter permease PstA [Ignatzschineria sp. RMDPL8A]